MRVLGAVRQSKTKDRAVSPTTQRERIRAWSDSNGHQVAKITEDLSKTGKMSAFRRPELGPWLTDPDKIATWDVLVATKLDRACRNTADYLKLRQWCEDNGKRLVLLDNPDLDTSKPAGRAMASIQAVFAEFERDMASERRRETLVTLAEQGRFPGGRVPYGMRKEQRPDGYYLAPDTGGTLDVLDHMADMAIAGKSNGQIADWLNGGNGTVGYLNSAGHKWSVDRVRFVFRSPEVPALLGEEKSAQLRASLRTRSPHRGERVGGHMLLRVAFCLKCGSPLYAHVRRDRPSPGYYRCLPCKTYISIGKLESYAQGSLLYFAGDLPAVRRRLIPGDDHQKAIHALEREIDTLAAITGAEGLTEAKQAEISRLKSLPYAPDHYEWVPTGQTVTELWESLKDDPAGKGEIMRHWGVRVFADPHKMEIRLPWLDEEQGFPLR
jgi:site-specific DNA recombinase